MANNKITFAGIVTRIYDEQRGERTNKYLVVTNSDGKYPDVLRFSLKPDTAAPCKEGDKVEVAAYVHGREWTSPTTGNTMYFTDLRVDTVSVTAAAQPAAEPTTTATDWTTLLAVGAVFGEDKAAVSARCKKRHPGKPSSQYTPADWQAVADGIVADHSAAPEVADAFDDDIPF